MRPNKIASLEALAEGAGETAETFEAAAQWVASDNCRALFCQLSKQRREMAHELEKLIREIGAKPRIARSDEASQRLMAVVRATLANQRPRALIDECERSEAAFAHILSTTDLGHADVEDARMIRTFHAEVIASLGQLAALKVRMRHAGL